MISSVSHKKTAEIISALENVNVPLEIRKIVIEYLLQDLDKTVTTDFEQLRQIVTQMSVSGKSISKLWLERLKKCTSIYDKIIELINCQDEFGKLVDHKRITIDSVEIPSAFETQINSLTLIVHPKNVRLISNCFSCDTLCYRDSIDNFYLFHNKLLYNLQLKSHSTHDSNIPLILPNCPLRWNFDKDSVKKLFASKCDLSNHLFIIGPGKNTHLLEFPTTTFQESNQESNSDS